MLRGCWGQSLEGVGAGQARPGRPQSVPSKLGHGSEGAGGYEAGVAHASQERPRPQGGWFPGGADVLGRHLRSEFPDAPLSALLTSPESSWGTWDAPRGIWLFPTPPTPSRSSRLTPEALCRAHLQLLEHSLDQDGAQLHPLQSWLRQADGVEDGRGDLAPLLRLRRGALLHYGLEDTMMVGLGPLLPVPALPPAARRSQGGREPGDPSPCSRTRLWRPKACSDWKSLRRRHA